MLTPVQLWGAVIGLAPFAMKLMLGDLTFAAHLSRKPHFWLRLAGSFFLLLCTSFVLYLLLYGSDSWIVHNTVYYFLLFLMSVACLKLPFAESMTRLIPCAVGGYMVEHISTQVSNILFHPLLEALRQGDAGTGKLLLYMGAEMGVFLVISGLVWYLFARNATAMDRSPALQMRLIQLSVVTLLVILVLSSVRDQYAEESYHLMVITRLFSIFSCVFLLYIRYDILEKGHLEAEHAQLSRVVAMERKQFEQTRENIELINIKCHDMRHKIEVWERQGGVVDREEIAEIKRMIDIYDRGIRTGNDTLDTILTERSLYCEREGIRLSCMADGARLGFLSTGDICSLFGNAVENAIEAVSRLSNPKERYITLQVRENRGMLVITVENNYDGQVTLADGLPQSTKGDEQNHGFGMKSIRSVAEKYGGEVTVMADALFHLSVLIPLPV